MTIDVDLGRKATKQTKNFAVAVTRSCSLGLQKLGFCRAHSASQHHVASMVDWLQSLKQIFTNVSYHILVVSLTLMALS